MKSVIFTAIFALVVMSVRLSAADWPQWRGPHRDGVSAETGLLREWPEAGPKVLWKATGIGNGYGSVAVVSGTAYVTGSVDGKGVVTALATDGSKKWAHTYGPEHTGVYPDARCTPTVKDGLVYVVSGPGVVSCVKADSGDPVWQRDMVADFQGRPSIKWGFGESVLIDGDNVICTPAGSNVTCVALSRKTGKTVWKSRGLDQRHAMCSPVAMAHKGRRIIVTQLVRTIVGISADKGEVLWTFDMPQHRHHGDAVKTFTPVCADGAALVSCDSTKLGSVKLRIADDGKSVTKAWSQERFQARIAGAVLKEGRFYGASQQKWMAVDWGTGEVLIEAGAVAGGSRGSCIMAGDLLFCRGLSGWLGLVQVSKGEMKETGSFRVPGAPKEKHWSPLSLADGLLYVRQKNRLLALQVR